MSFGIPVRNGLSVGLLASTFLTSGSGRLVPRLTLNFLAGAPLDSRITFSRTTNATLVDATGNLTYAPNNLVVWSEEFDNAAWTKTASTITPNAAAAPNGTTTADKLVENTAVTTGHFVLPAVAPATVAGQFFIYSVYAKAGERTFLQLIATGVGPAGANLIAGFDLTAGTAGTPSATVTSVITPAGDGWYRCSIAVPVVTTAASSLQIRLSLNSTSTPSSYTGDGTSGLFIWGAQFDQVTYQTLPSTYVQTVASAYYGPRFDYNPTTLAPLGLLIEEQRVNLALQSNGFGTTPWSTGASFTTTANQIISPDGTNNGWKFALTTGAAANLFQTITATSTSCAYSLYVKQGTGPTTANVFGIRNSTTATNLVFIQLNYSTGAFVYTAGSTGATVTNAGNGWWRVQMVVTSGITVGNSLFVYAMSTSGAAGDFAYLYGAQFEAGSFATSYIPTVASTVTRAADNAVMTGTNFSSWYNQSEGTIVASVDTVAPTGSNVLSFQDGAVSFNNRHQMTINTAFTATVVGGVTQANIGTNANLSPTLVYAYKTNDFAACANGAAVSVDTSGTVPTTLAYATLGKFDFGGAASLNGHIRYINYYATRLTNAQLQALSS